MNDEEFKNLIDKDKWVRYEMNIITHCFEMLSNGLAVRKAGLIYFLPLCHDAYNENI